MSIDYMPDSGFRGNIHVVRGEKTLFRSTSGFAHLADGVPNTADTRFASASAGKVFVATGILQLVERGVFALDDTLGKLLDIDLRNIDPDVTVEQLLTHTSGVPDYFDETVMDDYEQLWHTFPNYRIRSNSDLLPLFIDRPMMYPKGTEFRYNNTGYVLLAMIIEQAAGVPFDTYLKENVFVPCRMESTGYFELDRLPARCASNYIRCGDTGDLRTNIYSVDVKGTGAGGAFVTVNDIINFWRGLLNGTLLSPGTTASMFARHSGDGSDPEEGYYGYGLWIIDNPGGKDYVYFQGCDPGVSFLSEYNPNNDVISVLVSNYGDNVWREMRKIRRAVYN